MSERFYITTPIYYANDIPHIGHTGTTVFADIIARYYRLLNKNVFFLTGTDEHGQKVLTSAQNAQKNPQEFVDELAIEWQEYWKTLNISNDNFIRTSMSEHKNIASSLLQKLWEKGDIYKGLYKGIYCWGCEEYKTESQLIDGKCPEHRPDQIEYKEEENYFFKISKYIPEVKKLIENGELKVVPDNKKNEMLSRIEGGVEDMSISRQGLTWGIPLPWDNSQVTYVWIEALMNYYTATVIWDKKDFWPADVHFLGKGNNWFHSVIWPSLLLALELPLPKNIFVHGYYNVGGQKMGKSLGNVISPQELIDRYGVDGTRYLLAASMPYSNDSDVTFDWFTEKYNADLANGLGNLVSRVAKFEAKVMDAKIPNAPNLTISSAYESFRLHDVIFEIQKLVKEANEYFSTSEPWKKDGEEQNTIIVTAKSKILGIVKYLEPIMPDTSNKIKDIVYGDKPSEPIFARIR